MKAVAIFASGAWLNFLVIGQKIANLNRCGKYSLLCKSGTVIQEVCFTNIYIVPAIEEWMGLVNDSFPNQSGPGLTGIPMKLTDKANVLTVVPVSH